MDQYSGIAKCQQHFKGNIIWNAEFNMIKNDSHCIISQTSHTQQTLTKIHDYINSRKLPIWNWEQYLSVQNQLLALFLLIVALQLTQFKCISIKIP